MRDPGATQDGDTSGSSWDRNTTPLGRSDPAETTGATTVPAARRTAARGEPSWFGPGGHAGGPVAGSAPAVGGAPAGGAPGSTVPPGGGVPAGGGSPDGGGFPRAGGAPGTGGGAAGAGGPGLGGGAAGGAGGAGGASSGPPGPPGQAEAPAAGGSGPGRSRRRPALLLAGVAGALVVTLAIVIGVVVLGGNEGPKTTHPTTRGVQWPSGANANPPNDIRAWEAWTGRPADVATVFTARDTWPKIVADDFAFQDVRPDSFPGKVDVAQPLFPQSGNEAACARGDYDDDWAEFGRTLVRNGRGDAYVRLGWEFNGNWFWWTPKNTATWKTCFQRAATAIRSTSPQVKIVWNMTAHRDVMANGDGVWNAYPGDAFVDVVSIDAYDSYPPSVSQKIFNSQCHKPSGACTVAEFARAHGKRFAVPEWGIDRRTGGGGDNPFYIEKMYEFFQANKDILAYEAYFTATDPGNVDSSLHAPATNPKAAKRYLELFGG